MPQAKEIQEAFSKTTEQMYNQPIPPTTNEKESTSNSMVCPAHIYIDKGMERIENKLDTVINQVDEMDAYIVVDKDRKERKNDLRVKIEDNIYKVISGVLILFISGLIAYILKL